ncbi:hypothetical protein GCM10027053_41030 [Intrasporangium mesophilum]
MRYAAASLTALAQAFARARSHRGLRTAGSGIVQARFHWSMKYSTKASAPSALCWRAAVGSPSGNVGAGRAAGTAAEARLVGPAAVVVVAVASAVTRVMPTGPVGLSGPDAEHAASATSATSAAKVTAYLLGGRPGLVPDARICVP